jgi:hypothetical protein
MDFVVTEAGVHHVAEHGLRLVDDREALRLAEAIVRRRGIGSEEGGDR